MSGGVDSSVVAGLLKRQGHDVIGITLQLYDHGAATARKGACCAGQDIRDARRVADALEIPHYVLDYEQRFADAVVNPFVDGYIAGETPVPCAACNQDLKFGSLLDMVGDLGADCLATGHYAELRHGRHGPELYRSADEGRDQSYFLFQTTRAQLGRLAFPLGAMNKAAVRSLARELGIPIADKPDSQDICFVPTGGYAQTIERLRPQAAEPGNIVDLSGRVLGQHSGIIHFTIGQRRGLGIAGPEPLFVVRLDAARREVIVGPRSRLMVDEVRLRGLNWIGDGAPEEVASLSGLPVHVRVRSTGIPVAATLLADAAGIFVRLAGGESGVAPGQACVLYADASSRSRVLGGGWIASATSSCSEEQTCSKGAGQASHQQESHRMMA